MKVLVLNRKTKKTEKFKLNTQSVSKLRDVAYIIAAKNAEYFVSVVAETSDDIDFIANSFHNMPLPATPAKRAVWAGDLAVFILLNYPKDI